MRNRKLWQNAPVTVILVAVFVAHAPLRGERVVTDAGGREVRLPDEVRRVFGAAPPCTLLILALAPELLVAANSEIEGSFYFPGTKLLPEAFRKLPVVGGWHGASKGANMEALLNENPQVVIAWNSPFVVEAVTKAFEGFKIPVDFLTLDRVTDEPDSLRLLGRALGRTGQAEALAADMEARLKKVRDAVDAVPQAARPTVYYALGKDGLETHFDGSFHFHPFLFVGGKSLFPGEQRTMQGVERVTIEEVIRRGPDVIVAKDPEFVKSVFSDPRWQSVPAVRDRRVHLIPGDPVNFLDRPPSFFRVLGVEWLASVLYPETFRADIVAETVSFYCDFLHVGIDEGQARTILNLPPK